MEELNFENRKAIETQSYRQIEEDILVTFKRLDAVFELFRVNTDRFTAEQAQKMSDEICHRLFCLEETCGMLSALSSHIRHVYKERAESKKREEKGTITG